MSRTRLSVEDQLELLSLYGRYARLVDGGDADGFVEIFTEDGSFARTNASPSGSGGSGLPPQAFRGRAELHQLIIDLAGVFQGKMRHQLTDIALEAGDGPDEARGTCYGLITDWREGQGRVSMHCTYSVTHVRTADGWRFKDVALDRLPAA